MYLCCALSVHLCRRLLQKSSLHPENQALFT
jgi:hypothetical protein